MIIESYRVLRNGGSVCYTVWGQPKNTIQFTILSDVLKKMIPDYQSPTNGMFNCYLDFGEGVKKEMEEVGFKNVRVWEQPINVLYKDGEEFVKVFLYNQIKGFAAQNGFDEQKTNEIKQACIDLYNEKTKGTLNTFSVAVFIGNKE